MKHFRPPAFFIAMNRLFLNPDLGKSGSWAALIGLSAVAVIAAKDVVKRRLRPKLEFSGKTVLITGGSRGLGLALAHAFGRRGAKLALCARDANELQQACDQLGESGIEAAPFTADITDPSSIGPLIDKVVARFGRIDALVNDAGRISVAPFESFSHRDFEEAMNLMFWAPVNLTLALLPHMKRQGHGHVINITSVGGRVAVPHLLPYSCAKFALVGFSTGLAAEAALDNIHVLTAVPGLMRTGSYLNADFRGNAKQEFAWFGLLGNVPGFSVAADYAAERICEAAESGQRVCTISLPAKILIACEAIAPDMTRTVLRLVDHYLLPGSSDRREVKGRELNVLLNSLFQGLTTLGRRAAGELNQ